MEKMDQTRTDCNLTRTCFPGETPLFVGEKYPTKSFLTQC